MRTLRVSLVSLIPHDIIADSLICIEPLFLSCAETDYTFPSESRNKAIDILIKYKKSYQSQVFSGVAHGFALRCNLEVPYERELSRFDGCESANLSRICQGTKFEEHR